MYPFTRSLHRSDQLLSTASVSLDEEASFQLRPDEPEESKYGSGSTECGLSSGEMSLTSQFALFGDTKPRSFESTLSGLTMTPHYHSEPRSYAEYFQQSSETAEAVAGIPHVPPVRSYSLCGSTGLYGSAHSQLDCDNSANKSGSIVSCHGSIPCQVEDDDEQLNWNPVEDVMRRISSKMKYLKKSVAELDVDLLLRAEGIRSIYKN